MRNYIFFVIAVVLLIASAICYNLIVEHKQKNKQMQAIKRIEESKQATKQEDKYLKKEEISCSKKEWDDMTKEEKDNFKYYEYLLKPKHEMLIKFFNQNTFGTSMPIMTYFSILEPIDRVVILEQLFDVNTLNSNLQDKLLLAYVKIGRVDLAKKVIESSIHKGESALNIWGLEQKINVSIPNKISNNQRIQKINEMRETHELHLDALVKQYLIQ